MSVCTAENSHGRQAASSATGTRRPLGSAESAIAWLLATSQLKAELAETCAGLRNALHERRAKYREDSGDESIDGVTDRTRRMRGHRVWPVRRCSRVRSHSSSSPAQRRPQQRPQPAQGAR